MQQIIRPKDYYIRDVDIEYLLKNLEILLKHRNKIFLESEKVEDKLYQEYLEYYNLKIKQLLKL